MIRNDRFLVYETDDSKQTPLHWAALRGQIDVVKFLIEKKAHINSKDLIGRTPLFHAARMNNLPITKILLAGRANPIIRTNAGKTPFTVTRH